MSNQQLELLVRDERTGHEVVPESSFFRMDRMSLTIDPAMPDNQFYAVGRQVASLNRSVQFFIGDWLIEAKRRGERCYSHAGLIFGLETSTLKKAYLVSSQIPPHRRRCDLSFDHHETVVKLENPEEQDRWLSVAEQEHLSGKELRESVKSGEVVRFSASCVRTDRDAGQGGPLAAIGALSQAIANAKREHGEDVSKWPKEKLRQWDRFLSPILTFGAEVRKAAR